MIGNFHHLPAERKVIYISAILGIVLFLAFLTSKRKTVAESQPADGAVDPGTGSGGGAYDPSESIQAAKEVSLASIAHQAGLKFSIASNSLSHDLGVHSSSGGGSGGISLFGISIGGGGHKEGSDSFDLTTSNDFMGGFEGSGLSDDEFQLLVQQGNMLVNQARAAQDANNAAGASKLNRYRSQPGPTNAPNGMHLEQQADGHYYWVRNAR